MLHIPIQAWNINRTNNLAGLIWYQVHLNLWVQDWLMEQTFLVINYGKDNVILGYNWLAKTNPRIDWMQGEITVAGDMTPQHDHPDTQGQWYLISTWGHAKT